jgi:hypothetical protein
MKWLALVGGFALGVLAVVTLVDRYALIAASDGQTGYILRVDRWTGRADYWVVGSALWREVSDEK